MSKAAKRISSKINTVALALSRHIDLLLARQGDDPLHDVRVAARRLDSTLAPFNKLERFRKLAALRQPIRAVIKLSNQLRDTEVQAALLAPIAAEQHAAWWQQWQAAHTHTDHAIHGALYQHMQQPALGRALRMTCKACKQAVRRTGKRALYRAIYRRSRRLKARIGQYRDYGTALFDEAATWHTLRLDCKRLRYLQEAYGGMLARQDSVDPTLVKAAQDGLGELRDVDILLATLPGDTAPPPVIDALQRLRVERLAQAEQIVATLLGSLSDPAPRPD